MKHRDFYLLTSAVLLLLTIFPAGAAVAQESAKTLEWEDHANIKTGMVDLPWSRKIDEIELEDILIDGRSLLIGQPFIGDIRNLVFRVKNVSDGPVGFVQITVTLPEIKHSPQIAFLRTPESKSKPLLPGEETELRIPPDPGLYDWLKAAVAEHGKDLPGIKRLAIDVVIIVSKKSGQLPGGCVKTRDPRNECSPRPSGR